MRKFALSVAAVLLLAAPVAANAGDRGKLSAGEARAAARAYVTVQVEALEAVPGLIVTSARVSGRLHRTGRLRLVVPVAFALQWEDEPSFVCTNRVSVTGHGRSIRTQPGHFDCY